jgi:hypothetical protein
VRIFWLLVALCAAWSTPAVAEPLALRLMGGEARLGGTPHSRFLFEARLNARLNIDVVSEAAALVQRLRPAMPTAETLHASMAGPALSVADGVIAEYEAPQLPSRYAWVERDTRAFWYAAGAGAVTTLGTHLLVGVPVLAVSTAVLFAGGGVPLWAGLGIYVGYSAAESLLSGLVAQLVFDSMAQTYRTNFITGAMAHMAGSMVSTTVVSLIGGFALLSFHGANLLAPFTAGAGIGGLGVLTLLGALPAVVVAGTAVIAIPALVTSWALAASAQPRDGYAIDPQWQALDLHTDDPTRRPADRVATISVPFALP